MQAMKVYVGVDIRFHSGLASCLFCDMRSALFAGELNPAEAHQLLTLGWVGLVAVLWHYCRCLDRHSNIQEGGGSLNNIS